MKTLTYTRIWTLLLALLGLGLSGLRASEGTSGSLALTEPFSARSAALGEAFTSVTNDIAAFGYNPSSLLTLDQNQASLMYQKGLAGDSSGRLLFGMPRSSAGLGLSLGYYDAGDAEVVERNSAGKLTTRTVNAKTDINLALGYAHNIGLSRLGITTKYIKSELMDAQSASAYAADLGFQHPIGEKMNVGASLLNLGSKLNYISDGDPLPRIFRAGMSMSLMAGSNPVLLLLDTPYHLNEKELRPALGAEIGVGPMALRLGYKNGSGLEQFSFGAGFKLETFNLDYSYGLVSDLDAPHRVSFSMKFGNPASPSPIVSKPHREPRQAVIFKGDKPRFSSKRSVNRVYMVQEGDTLKIIALKMYGDPQEWKRIESANKHLDLDPSNLVAGSRIIIP